MARFNRTLPIWHRMFSERTTENCRLLCIIMNYLLGNQIKQMERMIELCECQSWDRTISFATLMIDFPVKWASGAFVLFIDSNPSFAALNLTENRARLSINVSKKPSDTSIMFMSLAHWVIFLFFKNQKANYASGVDAGTQDASDSQCSITPAVITNNIFPLD